jgi:hypothetical protein
MASREARRQRYTAEMVLFGILLLFGQAPLLRAPGAVRAEQSYDTYFRFLNDYPNHKGLGWAYHAQGGTHDDDHWYITQEARIWRFPVTLDLNSIDLPFFTPGVTFRNLITVDQLWSVGYGHLGDPTYYKYGDQGYLLVPLEYNNDLHKHKPEPRPAIGVFRYDPKLNQIVYVAHSEVPQTPHAIPPNGAPWCAVDPAGYLYSSNYDDASTIFKYHVDWKLLQGTRPHLELIPESPLILRDEGGSVCALQNVQGGEISPDGQLLYFVARDLHVFNISTGRRIRQSSNGSGWFNYEVRGGPYNEIPEGLAIWDLDDGRAPGIRGQLHVFLLNKLLDIVWFKHYDWTISVDGSVGTDRKSDLFPLTPPFKTSGVAKTVGDGQRQAWDGAHISIQAGSYPEKLTLSKPVKLVAKGGTVTIGK